MKTHHVYLITRSDGQKYCGVTIHPERRFWEHCNGYGSPNLKDQLCKMRILFSGSEEEAYNREPIYIKDLECTLNKSPGGQYIAPCPGESNGRAVLTEEAVVRIRELSFCTDITQTALGQKFGVNRRTISAIINGTTWKHVGGPIASKIKRLSAQEKELIKELKEGGMSSADISRVTGIKYHTVYTYYKGIYK